MSKETITELPFTMIEYEQHRNAWASFRHRFREPMAEFLGTMILLIFGTAVNCQVTLSANRAISATQKGDFLSICIGWGAGAAFGTWASMGISGGHINPIFTLVYVLFRRQSWRKLFIYIPAQVAGAFVGSLIVYGTYWDAINIAEGGSSIRTLSGTASLFTTFPVDYISAPSCFFSEFIATAMLVLAILPLLDKKNGAPPGPFIPLMVFIAVAALSSCLTWQSGGAMNPARDLGPRLMTAIFYGREVWTFRNHFWLWTPIAGDVCGAIIGAAIYDLLIYTSEDSRVNRPRKTPSLVPQRYDTEETQFDDKV